MSYESFFSKFPIISYKGTPSLNIMKRIDLNINTMNFVVNFYPITLDESQRIENIAFDYYNHVDYDWMIYIANGIIDPYHDILKSNSAFENYIKRKYGSLAIAKRTISHFANNAASDDSIISTGAYNSLSEGQKKYWKPMKNSLTTVGYSRLKEDFTASTNIIQIIKFQNPVVFKEGEIISVQGSADSFATVVTTNEYTCTVKHVKTGFNVGNTYIGELSNATNVVDEVIYTQHVIAEDEQVYYSPKSFYEIEFEENESKRSLNLIERTLKNNMNQQLTELLK